MSDKRIDISTIMLSDLLEDRTASLEDIETCKYALERGVTRYGGQFHNDYSVQDRMETNKAIVERIEAELKRRNVHIVSLEKS